VDVPRIRTEACHGGQHNAVGRPCRCGSLGRVSEQRRQTLGPRSCVVRWSVRKRRHLLLCDVPVPSLPPDSEYSSIVMSVLKDVNEKQRCWKGVLYILVTKRDMQRVRKDRKLTCGVVSCHLRNVGCTIGRLLIDAAFVSLHHEPSCPVSPPHQPHIPTLCPFSTPQ
jgi:hypothetical protein